MPENKLLRDNFLGRRGREIVKVKTRRRKKEGREMEEEVKKRRRGRIVIITEKKREGEDAVKERK